MPERSEVLALAADLRSMADEIDAKGMPAKTRERLLDAADTLEGQVEAMEECGNLRVALGLDQPGEYNVVVHRVTIPGEGVLT